MDFSTSDGKTKFQTWSSQKGREFPVFTPSQRNPTLDGSAMSPECLTAVCQSSYCTGHFVGGLKCSVGGQKKCFKDCLKEALKNLDNPSSWESLAQDCPAWCSKVTTGANAAKYQQTTEPQRKRATCKGRASSTSTAASTHSCPKCG